MSSIAGSDDDKRSIVRSDRRPLNEGRERPRPFGLPRPRPRPKKTPQAVVDDFWESFNSKYPGKVSSVLPDNYYAKRIAQRPDADEGSHNAVDSFEEAARICRQKVDKIVGECKRINQKYRDPHFDLYADFYQTTYPESLHGLIEKKNDPKLEPKSVKRVGEIFTAPQFFIKGATANDVRQGRNGDCWLMSALGTVSNCKGLIEKLCVQRDEKVGVYGFVFHRDGAWYSEVVDDKLFLLNRDFYDRDDRDDANSGIKQWMQVQDQRDVEKEYKKRFQTGSKALYFAQCSDPNETWLPLLEKAFAKAHGDYLAVEGGFVGEAIEDLTGGVTSELHASDILDRDDFWEKELLQVNKQFLFGCGQNRGFGDDRSGIQHRHAYSIMEAKAFGKLRLVKLRNPWGNTEWTGPWSDGSEEWTAEWMEKLSHKFGNDGVFWISFDDLLNAYQHFDRTRLFDESWKITQQWLSLQVPWSIDYLDTYFVVDVNQAGEVVIVLSQLDDRYYRGLEGQYNFALHFRVHREGESDYLVRSPSSYNMRRSTSTEVTLDAGRYEVFIKIVATRNFKMAPEDVVRLAATRDRREKLLAIGLSRDLAFAKAQVKDHDQSIEDEMRGQRRAKRKEHAKAAKAVIKTQRERQRERRKKIAAKLEAKSRELWPEDVETDARDRHDRQPSDLATERGDVVDTRLPPNLNEDVAEDDRSAIDPGLEGEMLDGSQDRAAGSEQVQTIVPGGQESKTGTETVTGATQGQTADDDAADILPGSPEIVQQENASVNTMPPRPHRQETVTIRETRPIDQSGPPTRQSTMMYDSYYPPEGNGPQRWADSADGQRPPPRNAEFPPYRQSTFNTSGGAGDDLGPGDLSWDSDIDAPSDSEEDEELSKNPFLKSQVPPAVPPVVEIEDDDFTPLPWNAVCVVGLRVFAKADNEVTVEVVRSRKAKEEAGKVGSAKELDRDHPAADRTLKGVQ
jgi:hypothetical protein